MMRRSRWRWVILVLIGIVAFYWFSSTGAEDEAGLRHFIRHFLRAIGRAL